MATLRLLFERRRLRKETISNYHYVLKMMAELKSTLVAPLDFDNLSTLIELRQEYADFVINQADFVLYQIKTFSEIEMKHWFWAGYAMRQIAKLNELVQDAWTADQHISQFIENNLITLGAMHAPEQH